MRRLAQSDPHAAPDPRVVLALARRLAEPEGPRERTQYMGNSRYFRAAALERRPSMKTRRGHEPSVNGVRL